MLEASSVPKFWVERIASFSSKTLMLTAYPLLPFPKHGAIQTFSNTFDSKMDTLGIEATPEEVDLMIDEIDQDNNGEIDFEGMVVADAFETITVILLVYRRRRRVQLKNRFRSLLRPRIKCRAAGLIERGGPLVKTNTRMA